MIRDTNIKVDRERCIACGICVDRCVMDNLRLSVAPCRQSCPLHINCQGTMKLIARGQERQAVALIEEFLPFLGVLGLLCHAPCEHACARKKVDEPVHIRALHRYLAEYTSLFGEGTGQPGPQKQSGKKAAIWGTGPASLMAAWRLGRSGHQVVMFDSQKEPGGALRGYLYMSDNHENAIRGLIGAITATGAVLETGVDAFTFRELIGAYDAAIITYKDDVEVSRILGHSDVEEMSFQMDPRTRQVIGREKVFIGKEFDGNSRLIDALAVGKTASESAHRFLAGMPLMWGRGFWEAEGRMKAHAVPYEMAKHIQQAGKESKKHEDDMTVKFDTKAAAVYETERCLGCGRPFDANQTCWYCLPCELDCPTHAIEVRIPYLLR